MAFASFIATNEICCSGGFIEKDAGLRKAELLHPFQEGRICLGHSDIER